MSGAAEADQDNSGYAISSLAEMGDGYGFRKIRRAVGVTAFGINALVLPAGYETPMHKHDEQEELYFVHQGEVEFHFGDGSRHRVSTGAVVRVDPDTPRGMRNPGQDDAILVIAGGKDGYVGRDGRPVDDGASAGPPGAPPAA